jgi:putative hydrolase of HD superfamily
MTEKKSYIQDMLSFAELMTKLQQVIRVVDVAGRAERENDVEHSYHLAMMAWFVNEKHKLGLNTDLLLRFALAHDLAEAYAGDVNAFDEVRRVGKEEREAQALKDIAHDVPHMASILDAVHTYEKKGTEEARFIYALDKLMPLIAIYLEGGKTWRVEHLTFAQLYENKLDKMRVSPTVSAIFTELMAVIQSHPEFFEEKQS